MEKKTFQDCCERVARNIELDYTGNLFPTLEQEQDFYKKAAELYNSETAKERDNALLSVALYVKELNDLKEERDRLKEENERLDQETIEKSHSIEFLLNKLGNQNNDNIKALDILRNAKYQSSIHKIFEAIDQAESLLSKATPDGYTKAKD